MYILMVVFCRLKIEIIRLKVFQRIIQGQRGKGGKIAASTVTKYYFIENQIIAIFVYFV
jgi:hypothetical protein